MENKYKEAKKLIDKSDKIVILSGAGISTNTGIPDFRGENGIYTKADIENPELIFDYYYFKDHPELFYNFHKKFLEYVEEAKPTYAYKKIFELEKQNKLLGIITQNIDSLHKMAGNKNVLEIHGGLYENFCLKCGKEYSYKQIKEKINDQGIPRCDKCNSIIKPDIVFFGEMVKNIEESIKMMKNSDLLMILGSSLSVTPAAYLPMYSDSKIIVVNKGDFFTNNLKSENIECIFDEDIDQFFEKVYK